MIRLFKSALILTLFSISVSKSQAQEVDPIPKDTLAKLVQDYYAQNVKIFQSNSTVEDIDKIFSLFTPDFIYIHPKYGGTYSRETLYNGYVRNQKNGGYDGSVIDIKVVNMIVGLNAVTVEKKFINKNDDGSISDGEVQMTLFEFKDGKISKIFEYW